MQQSNVVTTDDNTYLVTRITPETILRQNLAAQQKLRARDANLNVPVGDPAAFRYHVQAQDILGITVWDHPELSGTGGSTLDSTLGSPSGGSSMSLPYSQTSGGGSGASQNDPIGYTVSPEGTVFFPYAGLVHVAGASMDEIRLRLTRALSKYIVKPQVTVRVLAYRSQQVQLTGEVKTPGALSITDRPMTVSDAIARAGGATATGDLQRVRLTRKGKLSVIDTYALLDHGDAAQDVLLQGGDIVNVPDQIDSRVFVLGEVLKPTTLYMNKGRLTLADALTGASGIDNLAANVREVFVFRGAKDNPTEPQIFQLDMTQPSSMVLASQFQMDKLDVIYVGTSKGVRFNRALNLITPTLSNLFYARELTR
ncbi:polysaccharide biosynthesis/export family protein [Robbsia sp. Bb-Pol-6]|uniref:Polysaccharide biosynthesis/export family protein n=1 Tax=Robbsia betulipollinis TaxID=2981849 RepID=A0ABT3ZTA2_9BURK|nr:polysaccharide biosynthesis/export family protein [Robbsia betulipollinis]MCY0389781.1 polysaccharide biosynthesis/export family protein [Robbsia betulipollinis]